MVIYEVLYDALDPFDELYSKWQGGLFTSLENAKTDIEKHLNNDEYYVHASSYDNDPSGDELITHRCLTATIYEVETDVYQTRGKPIANAIRIDYGTIEWREGECEEHSYTQFFYNE